MSNKPSKEDCEFFVRESEAITGINPFDLTRPSTIRHLEISQIIGGSYNFVLPYFINGMITGKSDQAESLLRSGREGALRNSIPERLIMKRLFDELVKEIQIASESATDLTDEEKDAFAWDVHHRFVCLHPFKSGNGRTARLLLNHVRLLMGRPLLIILDSEAEVYFSEIADYRERNFIPTYMNGG
jgi:hypothetical protein